MTSTHLKSITKIALIGLTFSLAQSADLCRQNEAIESLLNSSTPKVAELKKLYKKCNNLKTRIAYLIRRGDESRDNGLLKSATADYQEALTLIEKNNFRIFDKYRDYLKTELGIKKPIIKEEKITTPQKVINSNELENYITKRSSKTRGAGMESFSQLKGVPINFNSGSFAIKRGINQAQANEIGKLLSKPKYKNQIIYITGYTDTRGSAIYNKNLSEKRAKGLKSYLVNAFGLNGKNIITEGLGESFPICKGTNGGNGEVSNECQEDYYRSRRVTLEYGE